MASIADVYVTVLPETSKLKEEIRRAVNSAERNGIKLKVEADTDEANRDIDRTRTTQERRKVTLKADFDDADLRRKLELLGDQFDGVGAKFASAFKWNAGLVGIGVLPALGTAITQVAGALQQLAGAGFAVPGIFAGLATSVGTAALGMSGMKDALEAVNKAADGTQASVDAANEALAGLAPNVAESVKTIAGLKGTFEDVRNIAGQNLFAGFSDGLKGLVGNLLPSVTHGINGVSAALNQNLLQAMDSLGSQSSQGFLDRIFGNTAQAQSKLTAAIDPIIHAVGTLTAAGSDALPRLADAIGKVADRFNNFITSADADGRLATWIDQGLDGFTNLGNIILNLGKSFTALTGAAKGDGPGLLETFAGLTERWQTFLNSAEGQDKLRQFFAQGREQLQRLWEVAQQLPGILSGIFNVARDAANTFLPVIRQVLDIINSIPGGAQTVVGAFVAWKTISGVSSLATALSGVANLLGALPGAAGKGAAGISAALAGVTVPAWLGYLVAGGSVAAVAPGASREVSEGTNFPRSRVPLLRRDGTLDPTGTPYGPQTGMLPVPAPGQDVSPTRGENRTALRPSVPLPTTNPAQPTTGFGPNFYKDWYPGAGFTPPPVTVPGVSEYMPPMVTEPAKGSGGRKTAADFIGGYTSDAALLANVPVGSYTQTQGADLTKGLADCSSAVEDLVNLMDGRSTAGRSMSTANAAEWLTAHGFLPGTMPGAFNVGFNSEHMQATLPGGTPFNWGSDAAAARGGVGGTGASDPAFTQHYYRPVDGSGSSPVSSAYPSSDYVMTGDPATDKRLRNAQQRVDDTAYRVQSAQARLDELNRKGTATARQRADAEHSLAVAKREHADAQTDLQTAIEKSQKGGTGQAGDGSFEQLGKDFAGGIMEVFGFGDLFKDPTQFGLFKLFQGFMGLKPKDGGTTDGSLFPGGGGGGPIDSLMSLIPKPFGDLNTGSPGDAPGQFMPAIGRGGGGTGGSLPAPLLTQHGQGGAPGPVVDQRIDMRGAKFGYSQAAVQDGIKSVQLQQSRQPLRSLPG